MSTSPQPKQLGFWESTANPLEDGKKKARSKRTVLPEVKGVSKKAKSSGSQAMNQGEPLFVTHESQLLPNVTILSDNLSFLSQDAQRLNSFQRLEADSILRGKNCSPFWNELCEMISKGLSLPTPTDCADSGLNWLDGYVNRINANSWFSITANSVQNKNLWQICCPSSIVSVAGYTDYENTENKLNRSYGKNKYKKSKKTPPNFLVKIPIFPCEQLHKVWKQWLASYRWVYNQCISFFNQKKVLPKDLSLDQYIQGLQKIKCNEWTQCLGKTRQEAVCEAEQAKKQATLAWKSKPIKERGELIIKFRSCRDKSQVIQFKNDAFKGGTWFPTKVNGILYCTAWGYEIPQACDYGTELVYQRGQWFACFPQLKDVQTTGSDKVIAFDPGNRTFLTGFDGENILEIGKGDIGRITRLCLHLDQLISKVKRSKGKENKKFRYKTNSAIKKLTFKIRCLVDDLHKKAANLIVNNYKLVFLPTYETSQMVLKSRRKINKKSVRNMLSWSFGRFATHLKQAAKLKGVLIIRTNESYTSKTCPHCGKIHAKLGGSKVFKCPTCGFTAQRDWVGAVNNMLAALQAIAFNVEGKRLSIASTKFVDVRVTQTHESCEA